MTPRTNLRVTGGLLWWVGDRLNTDLVEFRGKSKENAERENHS